MFVKPIRIYENAIIEPSGKSRLPVKTLQLEQMAVTGQAEEPSVVASRMRLVFSTLEVSLIVCVFNKMNCCYLFIFTKCCVKNQNILGVLGFLKSILCLSYS